MFAVVPDPHRRLVRIELRGMLTLADAAEMVRQQQVAARQFVARGEAFAVLVENRGLHFQTQQVMQALERHIRTAPLKARRLAVVRSSAASWMQARRLAKLRDAFEVFDDLTAATAWLADGSAQLTSATMSREVVQPILAHRHG